MFTNIEISHTRIVLKPRPTTDLKKWNYFLLLAFWIPFFTQHFLEVLSHEQVSLQKLP